MKHTDARIQKAINRPDCTCEAIIGARTEELYREIWEGMTKRGCLEIDAYESDYGFTGHFICPSQTFMRKFVRDIKSGKPGPPLIGKMKKNFAATYRIKASSTGFAHAIHSSWEMVIQLFVRV